MIQTKLIDAVCFDETGSTWNFGGSCSKCSFVIPPLKISVPVFFEKGYWTCQRCGASVDLWAANVERSRKLAGMPWGIMSLGAAQTHLTVRIEDGKAHTIDFTQYGVPKDATILSVAYAPQGGGVFPIEWHGNMPPRRRYAATAVTVIGRAMEGEGPASDVAVLVCWVQHEEPTAWLYLIDAFEAMSERRYTRAIAPAQSAVEIMLMPIINNVLKQSASADNVRGFIADIGFGHAINVILPFICQQLKLEVLPDEIRGSLNRLRRLRNEIVHEGLKPEQMSKEDAAECLCASVFGFEYLRWIREKLQIP